MDAAPACPAQCTHSTCIQHTPSLPSQCGSHTGPRHTSRVGVCRAAALACTVQRDAAEAAQLRRCLQLPTPAPSPSSMSHASPGGDNGPDQVQGAAALTPSRVKAAGGLLQPPGVGTADAALGDATDRVAHVLQGPRELQPPREEEQQLEPWPQVGFGRCPARPMCLCWPGDGWHAGGCWVWLQLCGVHGASALAHS